MHREVGQAVLLLDQLDLVSLSGVVLCVLSDLLTIFVLVRTFIMLLHGIDDGFCHDSGKKCVVKFINKKSKKKCCLSNTFFIKFLFSKLFVTHFVRNSQSCSTFSSSSCNKLTTSFSCHSGPKSMSSFSNKIAGLISSFHKYLKLYNLINLYCTCK